MGCTTEPITQSSVREKRAKKTTQKKKKRQTRSKQRLKNNGVDIRWPFPLMERVADENVLNAIIVEHTNEWTVQMVVCKHFRGWFDINTSDMQSQVRCVEMLFVRSSFSKSQDAARIAALTMPLIYGSVDLVPGLHSQCACLVNCRRVNHVHKLKLYGNCWLSSGDGVHCDRFHWLLFAF